MIQVLKTLVQKQACVSVDPQKRGGREKVARFGREWSDSFSVL